MTSGWQFVARSVESASARRTVPTAQESRDQVCRVSGGELSAIEDSRPSQTGLLQRPFYAVLLAATPGAGGVRRHARLAEQSDSAADRLPTGRGPGVCRHWHTRPTMAPRCVRRRGRPCHGGRQAGVLVPADRALAGTTLRSVRRKAGSDATPQLTRPLNVVVAIWFAIAAATAVWVTLPGSLPTPVSISMRPGPNLDMILLTATRGRIPSRSTSASTTGRSCELSRIAASMSRRTAAGLTTRLSG